LNNFIPLNPLLTKNKPEVKTISNPEDSNIMSISDHNMQN